LNFAGDLGLAEEAMAADRPHDFKSLDGGRRCSHRLKTAGGTDLREIVIRDAVLAISPHAYQDDLDRKSAALEEMIWTL
jgi:hypothetical protein